MPQMPGQVAVKSIWYVVKLTFIKTGKCAKGVDSSLYILRINKSVVQLQQQLIILSYSPCQIHQSHIYLRMPNLQFKTAEELAQFLALEYYGLTAKVKPLAGEKDWNFYLQSGDKEFILKVQSVGTKRKDIEMQHAAMQHLDALQLPTVFPSPIPNKNGQLLFEWETEEGPRLVHLLTWVPGKMLAKVNPHSIELLNDLGHTCGALTKALIDFEHPAAVFDFDWNPSCVKWTEKHFHLLGEEQGAIANYFLKLFREVAKPTLADLRQATLHFDANDYNVVVGGDVASPKVTGLIDFGDMHQSHLINDLAITCAYAAMSKTDPLTAAAAVVKGYHQAFPLEEKELAVLFPMIAARLMISVCSSAINKERFPDNKYLLVSEAPAWDLLRQWRLIHPQLAHFTFRNTCGFVAHPNADQFKVWCSNSANDFHSIVKFDFTSQPFQQPDLSIGSLDLGHNTNFESYEALEASMQRILDGKVGIAGYGEVRPIYTTDAYEVETDKGPHWRTVHLGIDIWMDAGSELFAPVDGIVDSVKDNAGERNYGPTIILKHEPSDGPVFYTLYGHLSRQVLSEIKPGQKIKKGEAFTQIGPPPENGNWPPHVHFQVLLDLLGGAGDFPGAAFFHQQSIWKSICPDPNLLLKAPLVSHSEVDAIDLIASRQDNLSRNLSLSYKQPLHMQRVYMQYLYDHTGRRYLDTVNNVPHVGHQHVRVVKAAQQQLALLNTNTRYLHKNILAFADKLLATLPPKLCVVHFVNSGSEANELALRMAKTWKGAEDMVVLQSGYHGNTNACVEISSYKFESAGGMGLSPRVEMAVAPDLYRGAYKYDDPKAGEKYAESVAEAITRVEAKGRGFAGFIHESILSCGGQLVLPEGYLLSAYAKVQAAGGLCIADEVQVGFGRVGDRFWGFELQNVVPDIVTMGKPIGNGHPLGAVVCTREVADAFNNGMEYFNTFGGNPVSCAIGLEVLNIIEEEGLQQHAFETGNYLLERLRELQSQFPIIGDVRGHGLFLGFELVKDRDSLEPAAEEATYLANRMRDHGILMSTDGPLHNVMKIKPPMCFTKSNANFLVRTLKKIFEEDAMKEF